MRILLILVVLIIAGLGVGWLNIKGYPYRLYRDYMTGLKKDKYYELSPFRANLLTPSEIKPLTSYKEDYPQLWKNFQVMNASVPLPTRHPLFKLVPLIQPTPNKIPQLGLSFQNQLGREITRLYLLPPTIFRDYIQEEALFKLPYARKRLLQISNEDLWKKIFTKNIIVEAKPIDEMIEDLFIHYIRHEFLPKGVINYGLIKPEQNLAIIEMTAKDKDYQAELVLQYQNGEIFSYVIMTQKNSLDSLGLRSKFIESISQRAGDESMGRILYTEFKQLNFARQVDQEGMLYLFSAWSQQVDNADLFKEMIFFLERGTGNKEILRNLYQYAFKRFGKTFSTRGGEFLDDEELNLQRKIELESAEQKKNIEQQGLKKEEPELTPEEKMNLYLKKAKDGSGPTDVDREKIKVD